MAEEMSLSDLIQGFNDLKREVAFLRDRQQIIDCIHRYARAIDRHDFELMQSVYHENGVDSHGKFGFDNPRDFMEWMNRNHDENFLAHHHQVTVHNCEIEGDVANSETYVIVFLVIPGDAKKIWVSGGRYLDRLERRNGEWKIAYRSPIMDWAFEADGRLFDEPQYLAAGMTVGTRDRTDPSYRRPYGTDPGWKASSPEELQSVRWVKPVDQ